MSKEASPSPRPDHSNVVLWAVFVTTLLGSGGFFLIKLHHRFGHDLALAGASLIGRSLLFVIVGLLVEALLLRAHGGYFTLTKARRSILHAYWVVVMLFSVALVVDVLVFAFGGYHLTTAVRILFSDGPEGVGQVVEATGLSVRGVFGAGAGLVAGLGVAIALSKWSRRGSARFGVTVTRGRAFGGIFVVGGVLAAMDLTSQAIRDPYLWERELGRVPLAFSFVQPRAELMSFRARVRPFVATLNPAPGRKPPPTSPRPDIVIVLIESLRSDRVTPDVMPRFSAYAKTAWTFDHPTTTGNVTHYSWYGLLCGRLPITFDAAETAPHHPGSLALRRLVDAGYRIDVSVTPDLGYQHLESLVFGDRDATRHAPNLHSLYRPTQGTVAERDAAVVRHVTEQLRSTPKGGHVYFLALDSTHFDYAWGRTHVPRYVPYAKTIPITHDYQRDQKARQLVINRYQNAVSFVDGLIGELLDGLAETSRLDESIVLITGDHGESFWEHDTGSHGSSLTREQLEVGFALHLPGRKPVHSPALLSLLDVMPTILSELGLEASGLDGQVVDAEHGSAAALTFQGWNEQAYHFTLTLPTERLLFELDHQMPERARRLVLFDVTNLDDESLVGHEGTTQGGSYEAMLRGLSSVLDRLGFLEF